MIKLVIGKEIRRRVVAAFSLLVVVLAMGLIGSAQATQVTPTPFPVGGEVVGIDTISVFLSTYWPLIALLLIPLAFALYKKRSAMPKWVMR